nr:hypothetical protein [Halomonas socia]
MLNWLKRTKLPEAWAIKQIDGDLLHVCGRGQLESRERSAKALQALQENRFEGAIRMHDSALVLNARLFIALAPVDDLILIDHCQAEWRGQRHRISWVPQRCWVYEGRLTATLTELSGIQQHISVEDVSAIRNKTTAGEGGESGTLFAALDALEILPLHNKDPDHRQ